MEMKPELNWSGWNKIARYNYSLQKTFLCCHSSFKVQKIWKHQIQVSPLLKTRRRPWICQDTRQPCELQKSEEAKSPKCHRVIVKQVEKNVKNCRENEAKFKYGGQISAPFPWHMPENVEKWTKILPKIVTEQKKIQCPRFQITCLKAMKIDRKIVICPKKLWMTLQIS